MARHKKISFELPDWVMRSSNECLGSVAEDAYYAKALARSVGAEKKASCLELLKAAEKSMRVMADPKSDTRKRCKEGDRAARKFWEAKVCARK